MSENQEIPRKRARVDDGVLDPVNGNERNPVWKRHDNFFKDDGDCYLLAENTIFKIHRFLLVRDSEVFKTMFSLPEGEVRPLESRSEGHPLILPDTAADIGALCWVLYALPMEIQEFLSSTAFTPAVVSKIVSVFAVCNKYQLVSYEKWAGDFVTKQLRKPSGSFALACGDAMFKRLLEIATATNMKELEIGAARSWAQHLKARPTSLKLALDTAEALGYRWFQGQIYYTATGQFLSGVKRNPKSAAILPQHFSFNEQQRSRLHHGVASMGLSWIFSMNAGPGCGTERHRVCNIVWAEVVAKHNNSYPKDVIRAYEAYLTAPPLYNGFSGPMVICEASKKNAEKSLELARSTVADHFLGFPQ